MQTDQGQLNPQQKEAVLTTEGPVIVLAGAGSGKTKVITHRIAHIIDQGCNPGSILAITFTNKAAAEMRQRTETLVGEKAKHVWLYTFHAFCSKVLRQKISLIKGYNNKFTILDTKESTKLIKEIYTTELPAKGVPAETMPSPTEMQELISKLKNSPTKYAKYIESAKSSPYIKVQLEIMDSYNARAKKNNSLDFDDLLIKTIEIFKDFPEVLKEYTTKFRYIMVDEFQDTNLIQSELIEMLAETNNICVVGDTDQSIYGWRGADIRNILGFKDKYPTAKKIMLEQNYRSTKYIIDAANNVIRNNNQRDEKTLWTNKKGSKIDVVYTENEWQETNYITSEIIKLHQQGIPYKDFTILYRNNNMSGHIETGLIDKGLPYHITNGIKILDRKEIKDILAYLRMIVNPYDELAVKRIINTPKRGISPATMEKVSAYAENNQMTITDVITGIEMISPADIGLKKGACEKLAEFSDLIFELNGLAELPCEDIIDSIIKRTDYINKTCKAIMPKDTGNRTAMLAYEKKCEKMQEQQQETKDFFDRLKTIAQEYDKTADTPDLCEFLNNISLMTDEILPDQQSEEDPDQIKLMTLHSSKGLEFPYVFIVGMEEGNLPGIRPEKGNTDDTDTMYYQMKLEEERRLCYVGITRAKEKLTLCTCDKRYLFGSTQYLSPSRFIKEIDPALKHDVKITD